MESVVEMKNSIFDIDSLGFFSAWEIVMKYLDISGQKLELVLLSGMIIE